MVMLDILESRHRVNINLFATHYDLDHLSKEIVRRGNLKDTGPESVMRGGQRPGIVLTV